jgi:thimet oligopeptidase
MEGISTGGRGVIAAAMVAGGLLAAWGSHAAMPPSPAGESPMDPLHIWVGGVTPDSISRWTQAHLAHFHALVARAVAPEAPATVAARFAPYDEASAELQLVDSQLSILVNAHADKAVRDAAQALEQKVGEESNALVLDARVYHALAGIDATREDAATRHVLERALLEYRLAGADRDDQTRAKLRAALDAITKLGLEFERNISESTLRVEADPSELAGLPADFVRTHPTGKDGKVVISTSPPEVTAVLTFASSDSLRRRIFVAYNNRAMPANESVLRDLMRARRDVAHLLGFATWADFGLADQMMASARRLEEFLARVGAASAVPSQAEYEDLLAFARTREPGLARIDLSGRLYWPEQYRKANLQFDSQSMRPYFPYAQVEVGILAVTGRFFHVRFDQAVGVPTWDPSVTTWDIVDEDAASPRKGMRIARIYLDMHPREGKDQWFNAGSLVPGILGRQMPEGRLVCNFPGGTASDPGLMKFEEVVTFFHELGHLMHNVLGGQGRWGTAGGFMTELDFIEAPSQMLEEVITDPALLQSFARHYQTGEVIPRALIDQMNRATSFGRAIAQRRQVRYATFAYELYRADPGTVDILALEKEIAERIDRWAPVPGTHEYASFGHLAGYASNYYTYVVDKVIAIDLYSKFDRGNAAGGEASMRYRRKVLEPGGTKPAEDLIADFLGRPWNFDAYGKWLVEGATGKSAVK